MNWSAIIVLTAGIAAGTGGDIATFDSYAAGWQKAAEVNRPMLVILNPTVEQVSVTQAVSLDSLTQDTEVASLLEKYVVVVVDTGTADGQKVLEAFGNKPLPYVAVIDEDQKKQVFQQSEHISISDVKNALTKYQDGAAAVATEQVIYQINPPGYCPSCQKNNPSFYSF